MSQPIRLGDYEVQGLLGEGGMGQVLRAVHSHTGRAVAIKQIHAHLVSDPEQLARFRREAAVLRSLDHPNLVRLLDHGESNGVPYLVFDLVEGEDLSELIALHPLPPDRALDLAHQAADAVAALHTLNLVHRDLKPSNLRIRPGDQLCVLDLGIAKHFGAAQRTMDHLTRAGDALGTLPYMPPEAFQERLTPAYDVWALGVILYEMLAGRRPFADAEEAGVSVLVDAIARAEYPALSEARAGVPKALDALIERFLTVRPEERMQNCAEAAEAIREAQKGLALVPSKTAERRQLSRSDIAPMLGGATNAKSSGATPRPATGALSGAPSATGRNKKVSNQTRVSQVGSAGVERGSAPEYPQVLPSAVWKSLAMSGALVVGLGVLGGLYRSSLRSQGLVNPGGTTRPSPEGLQASASGEPHPDDAGLRELARRLEFRLTQNRDKLGLVWLRQVAGNHPKQLRSRLPADKAEVRSILRGRLQDLKLDEDLDQFLEKSSKYFGDTSIPESERRALRSALCDLEIAESFCDEHGIPSLFKRPIAGCAGGWDEPVRPWKWDLVKGRSWGIHRESNERGYFPDSSLLDSWHVPAPSSNERLFVWYRCRRWRSGLLLDLRVNRRFRRIVRYRKDDNFAGVFRINRVEFRMKDETLSNNTQNLDPNDPTDQAYLGIEVPRSLYSPDLQVEIRMVDLPYSAISDGEPILYQRYVSLVSGEPS